jgi:hypothetical protein
MAEYMGLKVSGTLGISKQKDTHFVLSPFINGLLT